MTFTLTITDPQAKLLFSDVFILDNESEITSMFKFLNEELKDDKTQNSYFLQIRTQNKTLIEVSTNSLPIIQNIKTKIYDRLIEKEGSPYCSPEFK